MRGSFNTTAKFFSGPGSATPGQDRGEYPCRFVVEDAISQSGTGSPNVVAYITLDAYEPRPAWDFPGFGSVPALADQVAFPAAGAVLYWVVWREEIIWHAEPAYYRIHLSPLPLPSVLPPQALALRGHFPYPGEFVQLRPIGLFATLVLASTPVAVGGLALASTPVAVGGLALASTPVAVGGLARGNVVGLFASIVLSSQSVPDGQLALVAPVGIFDLFVLTASDQPEGALVLFGLVPPS